MSNKDGAVQSKSVQPPATVYGWADLVSRLVHVHVGQAKETHNLTLEQMGISVMGEDGPIPLKGDTSRPLYYSPVVDVALDALVTGVDYRPPNVPARDEDALFPHGRLTLTVNLFLDKPLVVDKDNSHGE